MRPDLITEVFPWQEEFSIGIPEVDRQHKELVRLINDLQAAMAGGQGAGVLRGILDDLVRYIDQHFAFEEEVMRQRGYFGLARHRAKHREFARRVHELQKQSRKGHFCMACDVMKFLRGWLAEHIQGSDKEFAGTPPLPP